MVLPITLKQSHISTSKLEEVYGEQVKKIHSEMDNGYIRRS